MEADTTLACLVRGCMTQTTITVYTREECHLCADAIETIRGVIDSVPKEVALTLVDIDADSELRAGYGERVPYVLVNNRPRFKYRVDEDELRSILLSENR